MKVQSLRTVGCRGQAEQALGRKGNLLAAVEQSCRRVTADQTPAGFLSSTLEGACPVILALGHTLHLVLGIAWSHKRMLDCQKTNLVDLGMSGSRGSMPGCVHTGWECGPRNMREGPRICNTELALVSELFWFVLGPTLWPASPTPGLKLQIPFPERAVCV